MSLYLLQEAGQILAAAATAGSVFPGQSASPQYMPTLPWDLHTRNRPPPLATPPIATRVDPSTPGAPSPYGPAWDLTEAGAIPYAEPGYLYNPPSPPRPPPVGPMQQALLARRPLPRSISMHLRGRYAGEAGEAGALDAGLTPAENAAATQAATQISAAAGQRASQVAANTNAQQHGLPPPFPALLPNLAPPSFSAVPPPPANTMNCPPGTRPNPGGEGCVPLPPPPPRVVPLQLRPALPAVFVTTPSPPLPQNMPVPLVDLSPPALPPMATPDTSTGGGGGAAPVPWGALAAGGAVLAFIYFGRKKRGRR
jgi:hypothetical protein